MSKKHNPYIAIMIFTLIALGLPFIINFIKYPDSFFKSNDLLAYGGAALGAIGTVVMGIVAIKQNDNLNEQNEKTQSELTELIKQQNEITRINKIINYRTIMNDKIESAYSKVISCSNEIDNFMLNLVNGELHIDSAADISYRDLLNKYDESTQALVMAVRMDTKESNELKSQFTDACDAFFISCDSKLKLIDNVFCSNDPSFLDDAMNEDKTKELLNKSYESYMSGLLIVLNTLLFENNTLDKVRDIIFDYDMENTDE